MGTKRQLAKAVAEVVAQAQPGIFLDAFSGMCSVGQEVGTSRRIWTNDIQVFASKVAGALFVTQDNPIDGIQLYDRVYAGFELHRKRLRRRYSDSLRAEQEVLSSSTFQQFSYRQKALMRALKREAPHPPRRSGNLFVSRYANNYFGVRQAIEIDAAISSLNVACNIGAVTADQRRWLVVLLGKTLLKISNSPGHFAQYLKPKESSFRTYIRQRCRRVWSEWCAAADDGSSVGTKKWRKSNQIFNQDSLDLLISLDQRKIRPSVVYADPPYTDDQYSRFYHILESLVLYDYPEVSGAGLYRFGRYSTPFSHVAKAASALDSLIKSTAKSGADLVLSYPTNGLVYEAGQSPVELLRKSYRKVEVCHSLDHVHSTFGASKGNAQASVTERIYFASA